MKSEYAFTLPRGLVDSAGTVHREGTMRLATARDEIEPLRSVEVRQNEAYLSVLLLARTITRTCSSDRRSADSTPRATLVAFPPCRGSEKLQ